MKISHRNFTVIPKNPVVQYRRTQVLLFFVPVTLMSQQCDRREALPPAYNRDIHIIPPTGRENRDQLDVFDMTIRSKTATVIR
jgi:hypothetical protein